MDNLEEDTETTTTIATTTSNADLDFDIAAVPPMMNIGGGGHDQDLDDSVLLIQPGIDVVDLTSPQASTSTSAGAGACGGGVGGLLKPKIEEPSSSKDTTPSSATTDNPSSSSTSGLTGTSSADAANTSTSNNLLECPICLQTCIHPARLPCGHIFCFLCVKGVAYKNRRCAMCRREIPPEFLDHPQLVNGIEDICTTKATDDGYQWFYEGRNGGWWAYDKRTALEIEEVFQILHQQNQPQAQVKQEEKEENKANVEVKVEIVEKDQENNEAEVQVAQNRPNNEDNEDNEDDYDDDDDDDDDDDGDDESDMYSPSSSLDPSAFTYNIQICGAMYTLDFKNMIQYPQTMSYRKRKICRAKGLPAKGVAGILNSSRRRNRPRRRPY